jgi:hypothetical protein
LNNTTTKGQNIAVTKRRDSAAIRNYREIEMKGRLYSYTFDQIFPSENKEISAGKVRSLENLLKQLRYTSKRSRSVIFTHLSY